MAFEFCARFGGGKGPSDVNVGLIAFLLPSQGFAFQRQLGGDTPLKRLANQDGAFDFGHLEPTAVFRRKVELEQMFEVMGTVCRKVFIKGAIGMGVEMILNDLKFGRVGRMGCAKPVPKLGIIGFRAPLRAPGESAGHCIVSEKERTSATPFIFIVCLARITRPHLQGNQAFAQ